MMYPPQAVQPYFQNSVKGLFVGKFKAGKTFTMAQAFNAHYLDANGQPVYICRPALYMDVEGGTQSAQSMVNHPDCHYVNATNLASFQQGVALANTGAFRLVIWDGWTHLFQKLTAHSHMTKPDKKRGSMGYRLDAFLDTGSALEIWSELAVTRRGIVLLASAALTPAYEGGFDEQKRYIGDAVDVSPKLNERLVGRNSFVWHLERRDPMPILNGFGQLDVEATNRAFAEGRMQSTYLTITQPLASHPYVKAQEGFAPYLPAVCGPVDFAAILRDHFLHEYHRAQQQRAAS